MRFSGAGMRTWSPITLTASGWTVDSVVWSGSLVVWYASGSPPKSHGRLNSTKQEFVSLPTDGSIMPFRPFTFSEFSPLCLPPGPYLQYVHTETSPAKRWAWFGITTNFQFEKCYLHWLWYICICVSIGYILCTCTHGQHLHTRIFKTRNEINKLYSLNLLFEETGIHPKPTLPLMHNLAFIALYSITNYSFSLYCKHQHAKKQLRYETTMKQQKHDTHGQNHIPTDTSYGPHEVPSRTN